MVAANEIIRDFLCISIVFRSMYERVEWWVDRSQSPEYQEAYDRIARALPQGKQSIAVEIGCGNGEILRRVHGRARKVYGTDISPDMLLLAQENLGSHSIDSHVFSSPLTHAEYEAESKRDRIALIRDDIMQTQLPEGYFDRALLVFQAIRTSRSETKGGGIEYFIEANYHAAKRLKRGGILLVVEYYTKEEVEGALAICDLAGIYLLSTTLVEEPRMRADMRGAAGKGYEIIVGRRGERRRFPF